MVNARINVTFSDILFQPNVKRTQSCLPTRSVRHVRKPRSLSRTDRGEEYEFDFDVLLYRDNQHSV